jgi:hypothetical protein
MYFFSVTLVAASAAAVLFGLSALYSSLTGVPYFLDSEIPSAVFLGLHLLVTDPSTSPRTPLGRLVFGVLYGLGVFGLYSLLGAIGAPTFYDKLLCVPLLNLSVPAIDRAVHAVKPGAILTALRLEGPLGRGNLAHMAVWILFFGTMTAMGRTDGTHPGDRLPFWVQACQAGRPNACERLMRLEQTYCADSSGWACNQVGGHYLTGDIVGRDASAAQTYFSRACELRFQAGCLNLLEPARFVDAEPRLFDFRLLLREGGLNLIDMPDSELTSRACRHGWSFACASSTTAASSN